MVTRPKPRTPSFDNFPKTLTALNNWVLWSYVLKDDKWTKVPKQPSGSFARTNDSKTWNSFDAVSDSYHPKIFDGVGIVLAGKPLDNGLYLIGLDFDHCLTEGVLDDAPHKAVDSLDTYSEISPSGEGIRLFLLHDKPTKARKNNIDGKSREVYSTGRYLTVTGHTIGQPKEVRHVS